MNLILHTGQMQGIAESWFLSNDEETITIRPHHLIDIVSSIGNEAEFKPHPYGHGVHTVANKIMAYKGNVNVRLLIGADDICKPCKNLGLDGLCSDISKTHDPPEPKQKYNDKLDKTLFEFLNLNPGVILSFKEFADIIKLKIPEIMNICVHPKENRDYKLKGLIKGLDKWA